MARESTITYCRSSMPEPPKKGECTSNTMRHSHWLFVNQKLVRVSPLLLFINCFPQPTIKGSRHNQKHFPDSRPILFIRAPCFLLSFSAKNWLFSSFSFSSSLNVPSFELSAFLYVYLTSSGPCRFPSIRFCGLPRFQLRFHFHRRLRAHPVRFRE